jgi:hypothetical protein
METKKCPDCGKEKPLDRFGAYNPYYCKDCLNERQKDYQRKKRQEHLAANPPTVRTSKPCTMCGIDKPLEQFNFVNKERNRRSSYCKPCQGQRAYDDFKRRGDPNRERLKYRCNKFGTTVQWYDGALKEQDGKCAICQRPETHAVLKGGKVRRLAIDHCHKTGQVCGLLCFRCNTSIRQIELNGSGWAERAVAYLSRHGRL